MKVLISSLLIVLLLTGCDETKQVIDTANQVQLSGNYTVVSIRGETISENVPTLVFDALEKGISGTTGCNRYFGSYSLDLYVLQFSDIASTEMACEQEIMDIENSFLQALRNTGSFSLRDGVLLLYSKSDRNVLLTARKNRPLQDTEE